MVGGLDRWRFITSDHCTGECNVLAPSSLKWSKISQAGLITHVPGSPGIWATDNLIKANFTSTTTIPKNLKAGNYVIRHEIIALHNAGTDNGAQLYPQVCLVQGLTDISRLTRLAVLELEGDRNWQNFSFWRCCW